MQKQIDMLRQVAREYLEIANEDRYRDNIKLHRAVNDRHMIRPVVLMDEFPWNELNFDGSLTPACEEPTLRAAEIAMRRVIFRHRHCPADMTVRPFIGVPKVIESTGIGLTVEEKTLATDQDNSIVAHEYYDQLEQESSLDRLRAPVITYDREESLRRMQVVGDAIGDILPVRLTGVDFFKVSVWDDISRYRGVTNLLIDLAERPEYMHRLAKTLSDFEMERLRQYEDLELFDPDPNLLHCTCAETADLPGAIGPDNKIRRENIWGRGAAQIFASVSRSMHDEFDIAYMKETIGSCGLSYYGCCEPLDKKIDLVEKIPNLRKISVTPWTDTRAAAEAIGGRYVVAAKPNPASVAVPQMDEKAVRKEIEKIVAACADFGCSCDIVLKDISTCLNRPQNLFSWEKVAMEVVKNA